MQLEKSIRLFEQIMRTVQSIHDMDIYHFDIKPDNILSDGVNHVLIDFGSSQLIKKKQLGQQRLFGAKQVNRHPYFRFTLAALPGSLSHASQGYMMCLTPVSTRSAPR